MTDENEVLKNYSTEGLRKKELDRAAKKDHLYGMRLPKEVVDKILDEIYGPEEKENDGT